MIITFFNAGKFHKGAGLSGYIAELGSAFLTARMGLQPTYRSASYLNSWLKVMRSDNRAIFTAASHAGQAADYLWKLAYPEEAAQPEYREAAE